MSAGATAVQAKPASAAANPTSAAANPYAPPAAPVSDPAEEADESAFIPGGRSVPAGRGWSWFAEAWGLFKESPLIWIVNFLVFMFVLIAIELLPVIGSIIGMLVAPVLGAGIMIGARAVHQGEALEVGHLFAGFRDRTGPLVVVGVLYAVGTAVIVLGMVMLMGVSLFGAMAGGGVGAMGVGVLLGILVAAVLFVPLLMAYWFAPALVALNGYTAFDAMKTSLSACGKNMHAVPGVRAGRLCPGCGGQHPGAAWLVRSRAGGHGVDVYELPRHLLRRIKSVIGDR